MFADTLRRARESLAVMRRAAGELTALQGRSAAKDRARTTKRVLNDLLDDLRAGLGR
jgi:hypothetical protein